MGPLTKVRKDQLAAMNIPSEDDMRRRTMSFIARAGLTQQEFADSIGYSRASLSLFMNGQYDSHHYREKNSLNLRAALKEFMDTHDVEAEVVMRGRHYDTGDYKAVRRSALNALERGTAYLLDGPPGTQKTWILRNVEHEVNSKKLGRAIYVYARSEHAPQSFLRETCTAAGIPHRGNIDQLLRKLRFFLGTGRTLLMVDEAQHLGINGLEVLRQLLDLPPYFGVILAGSHDLSQRLSHWQMEQWRSRLRKKHYLDGLSESEAKAILISELGEMPPEVLRQTIAAARSEGSRNNRKFSYISARNLFDAIEAAKLMLSEQKSSSGRENR